MTTKYYQGFRLRPGLIRSGLSCLEVVRETVHLFQKEGPVAELKNSAAGFLVSKGSCQVFFAKWIAGPGMSEVSQQWKRPQGPPPGASCSCTSCCPTGCRPHGAGGHRPASERSCRPGSYPPHGYGGGSPGSAVQ